MHEMHFILLVINWIFISSFILLKLFLKYQIQKQAIGILLSFMIKNKFIII